MSPPPDPAGPDSGSPLEAVSAGEPATEAFELLSNETRLAILVALWESHEPFGEGSPVRFSELRSRVGVRDSGQFNYHLDKLEGHFVESTGAGYRLTQAGLKFVRSVVAGAGIEAPRLEPTEVDTTCTMCGASVAIAYERGWVHVLCTGCEGLWTDEDRFDGHLAKFPLDPAGLVDRSAAEIYAAAWVHSFQRMYSMIEGVCPVCTGPVERSLLVCDAHESAGTCSNCGRAARTIARLRCAVCKNGAQTTIGGIAKYHPRVVAFCYDRGLSLQYGFNDLASIEARLTRADSEVEHLSRDPPRIRVTTELDGDGVWIELDERLNVVAVED
jgi:DNA-binding transcriptional ArsR family regulator